MSEEAVISQPAAPASHDGTSQRAQLARVSPSQGSRAITAAGATPRAGVTSVRYITKGQAGSNVALLDVTPPGSGLQQGWFLSIWPPLPSFGVKSSFSSRSHRRFQPRVPAERRKFSFKTRMVKGLSDDTCYVEGNNLEILKQPCN